jgi:hypothetical protein
MAKKQAAPPAPGRAPKAPRPPTGPPDPVKQWETRLRASTKLFEQWAKRYRVERLLRYYLGEQWHGLSETEAQQKYVINLIFATLETQIPSLMFTAPKVKVDPRPGSEDEAGEQSTARATTIESAVQTVLDDPKVHFVEQTKLALRQAYTKFGVVEVGYTADWIDNPNADKPVLNEDESPMLDGDGAPVTQPKKLLRPGTKEAIYVRQIPALQCRVGGDRNITELNDWFAYYEWHYVEDVKANKEYDDTAELKATGTLTSSKTEPTDDPDHESHIGMVKLWKIFDLRAKERLILADGHRTLLQRKPFTFFPIAVLKFYEVEETWLPLPPLFNWVGPQDEINESREMQRVHRRRAKRFFMRDPSVDEKEFQKLETGEDMTCIVVPRVEPPLIAPISDAPLDSQNWQRDATTKEDFVEITGVSGEAKGIPQSDTATQANIINVRAQLRESYARTQVAAWLAAIARLVLLTMREKMALPFMVKRTVDPFTPARTRVAATAKAWQEIKAEDIDELDVDIRIDVASMSPVAKDAERMAWNVVLQLFGQMPIAMLLFTENPDAPEDPPPLLRKTLSLYNITHEAEVQEIWRVGRIYLQRMAMMAAAQAANKAGLGGGPAIPGLSAPTAPPSGPAAGVPTAGPAGVQ